MVQIMQGGLKYKPDEVEAILGEAMRSGDPEGALERLNVSLWSKESQEAAEHLHTLGATAQTAAERISMLGLDPKNLPSNNNSTSQYNLDPGQSEMRKPAVTATPTVRMYNGEPFGPTNHPRGGGG